MTHDTMLPFSFPAVCAKKITAAFDGGRISSDGGVMLLAQAEHRLGIAEKLAAVITDPRDPMRVVHSLPDILRVRMLAIACGYEDADDLDRLRFDASATVEDAEGAGKQTARANPTLDTTGSLRLAPLLLVRPPCNIATFVAVFHMRLDPSNLQSPTPA